MGVMVYQITGILNVFSTAYFIIRQTTKTIEAPQLSWRQFRIAVYHDDNFMVLPLGGILLTKTNK